MSSDEMSRRLFLARIAKRMRSAMAPTTPSPEPTQCSAGAALLPACVFDPAHAPATDGTGDRAAALIDLGLVIDLLRPVLAELSRGTLNGFVALSLPGQDAYSQAQGTPRGEPGGIEAGGTDFLLQNLDRFLPVADGHRPAAAIDLAVALRGCRCPPSAGSWGSPTTAPLGRGRADLHRIQTAVKTETRARRVADFVAMLARREKIYP